jgi:hypothetical protein
LRRQLELVVQCFEYIHSHPGDLDLQLTVNMNTTTTAPAPTSPSSAATSPTPTPTTSTSTADALLTSESKEVASQKCASGNQVKHETRHTPMIEA